MNEGWATYWHSQIMTEKALKASEIIDYADHSAGVLATAPGQLNPYKLGIELCRDIEERWDKGQFGKEWDECDDLDGGERWDQRLGLGKKKIFEVRKLYNDVTFIDEFLTADFCARKSCSRSAQREQRQLGDRFARVQEGEHKLLFSLTNFGQAVHLGRDSNHENRGELLLRHDHQGVGPQDGPRARRR